MSIIESLPIHCLDISNLAGKVKIKVHNKPEILIETTNEDKIKVTRNHTTLKIQGKELELKTEQQSKNIFSRILSRIFNRNKIVNSNLNVNVINGNIVGGNIIINGKNISSSSFTLPEVKMDIFVPKDTVLSIMASGVIEIDIDEISDSISIDASGQTQVKTFNIDNVYADVSGQSKINVDNVKKIKADVSGQSKILASSTEITNVEIDISGQSVVIIAVDFINNIEADLSGQSELIVYGNVKNKTIDKSGLSTVSFNKKQ